MILLSKSDVVKFFFPKLLYPLSLLWNICCRLEKFFAGPCETFEPHYGYVPKDAERGDGDIFKLENIKSFSSFVLANTDGEGVHLMMADGVIISITIQFLTSSS